MPRSTKQPRTLPLGPGYQIEARVLMVQQHRCKHCGSMHSAPGQRTMLRTISPRGAKIMIDEAQVLALFAESETPLPPEQIPNEIDQVEVAVERCQSCFAPTPEHDLREMRQFLAQWRVHLSARDDDAAHKPKSVSKKKSEKKAKPKMKLTDFTL